MDVLVFKTSVKTPQHVSLLKPQLDSVAGKGKWNFALDDCDRILRIVSAHINPLTAINLLQENGYECAELEE
ncbi:MAG TPA: hypothetical protein VFM90_01420 [Cyclobacteriaceae bacterium]|nr:hypothetical protein [Cyclobacteriaceae bacterium]